MPSKKDKPIRLDDPAGEFETKAAKVARLWAEVQALRSARGPISLQAHAILHAELVERLRQLKELGEEL